MALVLLAIIPSLRLEMVVHIIRPKHCTSLDSSKMMLYSGAGVEAVVSLGAGVGEGMAGL